MSNLLFTLHRYIFGVWTGAKLLLKASNSPFLGFLKAMHIALLLSRRWTAALRCPAPRSLRGPFVMAFLPFCLSFPPREKWRRDTKESERINRTEREGLFSKAADDAKKKNPPPQGFLLGQKSGQGQIWNLF